MAADNLNFVFDGVENRYLGCIQTPESKKCCFTPWGDSDNVPIVARKEWSPISARHRVWTILDQDGQGACFPAGTLVRMYDGTEKPIENISLLNEVLTAEGNKGIVTATSARKTNNVYRLVLCGHSHLRATAEHPILTKRGYVKISELESGDMVAMPKYAPATSSILLTHNHICNNRTYVSRAKSTRTVGIPGKTTITYKIKEIPDVIQLTPGFGRIVGLFLAEGHTDKQKVVWTFGKHEEETLAAELSALIYQELGAEAHIQNRPHSVNVVVYGTNWAKLFESLCGTGSGKKCVHTDILSGPKDFLKEVFEGWMDGDGYQTEKRNTGVSVSHSLAMSMFDIAQMCGLHPIIRTSIPKLNGNVKTRQNRWDVEYHDSFYGEETETHIYRKVKEVIVEDTDCYVYNMTVQGDNSYVTEGIGVHNCVGFSSIQGLMMCREMIGLKRVLLSAGNLYGRINGGRDAGAMIGDALTELMARGACTAATVPQLSWQPRTWPSGWQTEAKKYVVIEAYHCPTFEHLVSALLHGFISVYGIMVGQNFSTDKNGWVHDYRGGGGGHALCGIGVAIDSNGKVGIETANSWTTTWGDQGFGIVPESYFRGTFDDFFALRAVVIPSDEDTIPVKQ